MNDTDAFTITLSSDCLTTASSIYDHDTITIGDINLKPSYNYAGYPYASNTGSSMIRESIDNGNPILTVSGDADFEGDLKIKGKSLVETLNKIEEKLGILYPNIELEEKWEELRNIRKRYMELEAEIKDKENVWGILKR